MAAPDRPPPVQLAGSRRRDAEENRRRIIDVAVAVLDDRPGASVDDIAAAAGFARRTFYGHFPTREALIHGMSGDSIARLLEVMARARSGGHPPVLAYARFIRGAWALSEQHRRLLTIGRRELGPEGVVRAMMPVNAQVAELVAAGQADGSFDDRLPAPALATVLQATNFALLDALNAGRWDGDPSGAVHACLVAGGVERREAARIAAGPEQPNG